MVRNLVSYRVAAAFIAATLTTLAPALSAPAQQSPKPAQIDRNGVLILVRSTLLALQQANETGNYTVLRDIGSPAFREGNNPTRLAEIFASLRAQKLDLSGVAVLDPQLTLLPQIEGNGMMHMAGFFPSVPMQINFELLYAPVNGRWKPYGISVRLGSSSPVAPNPPQPEAVASAPKAEKGKASSPAAKPDQGHMRRRSKSPPQAGSDPQPEKKSP